MKHIFSLFVLTVLSVSMLAENTYVKLTATPDDWVGTYLIVCESENVIFNGAADEDEIDAKGGYAILSDIAISNAIITGDNEIDAATFTIEATDDTDWPWAIKSQSGLYLGHKDTTDNGLSTETSIKKKCRHTLSIDSLGNFVATPRWEESGAYNLQYNKKSEQLRFRYYEPDDKEHIQIYRLQEASSIESLHSSSRIRKVCENGQIYILHDGVRLNLLGTRL